MSGMLGRLLREFAVTICVAILVSGFISLSLTPMLVQPLSASAARPEARLVLSFPRPLLGCDE